MATLVDGNLAAEENENDIRAFFERFGTLTSVRHISRRGLAYVELDDEAANAAIEGLCGEQLKGRTLDVAMDRPPGGGRPGGGGRRRGRGRR